MTDTTLIEAAREEARLIEDEYGFPIHPANTAARLRELADALAAAQERIERLERDKERLIEDRARFPDRPDWVGDMIGAHFKNLEHKAEAAEGYAEKYRTRLVMEQRKHQKLQSALENIVSWGNSDHCTKLRSIAREALTGGE